MAILITAIVVIVAVLAVTKAGRDIDAATQHFMLYYAGVLALVGLTGSVLLGLVATDRIVMTPGHRVMAQAVHRAFSFGTLAFLIIHIVTEILAQRSHVIDAVVPFLSPYRTFYIGLGTIASDLIVLLVVTSIVRKRFTAHGKAWRWRAIHYSSYVAFVFGVLHGLLGGRAAKPYVDWSYGFAIAVTALGLAVRFLAISLRPKESLRVVPQRRPGQARRLVAAARRGHGHGAGAARRRHRRCRAGAAGRPGRPGCAGPTRGPRSRCRAGHRPPGRCRPWAPPRPTPGRPADAYHDLGFTPLGAPPYGDDGPAGMRARPYVTADQPRPALAGPARQPLYEPGYDGPPRFEGAPRGHGDIPQDELSSYPYGPQGRRPPSASPYPEDYTDRARIRRPDRATRPGVPEPARPRAAIPAPPRPGDRNSGPMPQLRTGPMPQPGTGPMPRPDTGPLPRAGQGQPPRNGMGPGTGPMPRAGTGPMPRADSGPMPRAGTGPMPRPDTGPMPRAGQGACRRATGPMPRPGTGPMPRAGHGPMPRPGTGPMPRRARVRCRAPTRAPMPRAGHRVRCRRFDGRPDAGPMPRPDAGGLPPRPATGPMPRPGTGPDAPPRSAVPAGDPATGPRTGPPPRAATRPSHRAKSTDPRYRDMPGPTGGDEWQ